MPEEDPDLFLVQALQSGEDAALNALMDRHQQRIFLFIFRHINHEADALELAQETFVRAYFNIHRFSPRGLFSTWLHQIALNLCRDHVRSKAWRNRQNTDSLSSPDDSHGKERELPGSVATASDQLQFKERTEALQKALEKLPIELKGPLLLTAVDGFSHQEAGRQFGLSAKAIELKVYRARKALAKLLGNP
jgi:RNA polymerase sigma-70 factor (ECF subfamily)